MSRAFKHHVYLAYAAQDREFAQALFTHLSEHVDVVFDGAFLKGGELWGDRLATAQESSLVTVAIISNNTPSAFYQQDEIARGISLSRQAASDRPTHRLVPVILPGFNKTLPMGLVALQQVKLPPGPAAALVEAAFEEIMSALVSAMGEVGGVDSENLKPPISPRLFEELLEATELPRSRKMAVVETHRPWALLADPPVDQEFLMVLDGLSFRDVDRFVVYIDIDRLTGVNSRYGSLVGDAVVKTVFGLLCGFGDGQLRCGKDEFVVYGAKEPGLYIRDRQSFAAIGSRMISVIGDYNWAAITPGLFVTACAGWAVRHGWESVDEWMLRAVLGCAEAKRRGVSEVCEGPYALPKKVGLRLADLIS